MNPISAFLVQNIVAVYFFYGLAFFVMGLALFLAGRKRSQFRFVYAIPALAGFGLIHGAHEWYEMFQQIAKLTSGHIPTTTEEVVRLAILAASFLALLAFGILLLQPAIQRPRQIALPLVGLSAMWVISTLFAARVLYASTKEILVLADVLARYCLGIPGALMGGWALMVQQRTFREHAMPQFGRDLVWCATALILYGVVGQSFVRPSALVPSNILNSDLFMEWFGIPVQLFRGINAAVLAIFMMRALNAFELENQRRLEAANEEKLQVQAAALEAERRASRDMEQLNEELRLATQELSLLLELSNLLESSASLQDRLQSALARIVANIDFPDAGAILLVERRSGSVQEQVLTGFPSSRAGIQKQRRTLALELGEQCIANGMALCRHLDGQLIEFLPEELAGRRRCQEQTSPVGTIGLPLTSRQQVIGSLVLDQSRHNSSPGLNFEEFSIILGIAQQLGLSIDNARLRQEAEEREKRLADLLHQVVDAQEAERQRIALELHDATGQSLTAVALGLRGLESILPAGTEQAISHIQQLKSFSMDALGELRQIISDLRPSQLDDLGLVAALQWYVQEFEQRYQIATQFTIEGERARLPSAYETVLFRITQEALTNVAKHSKATQATLHLVFAPNQIEMTIADNGRGFDPKTVLHRLKPPGWGLVGIQERALLLGGHCEVTSVIGQGTHIRVCIPLTLEVKNVQDSSTAGR